MGSPKVGWWTPLSVIGVLVPAFIHVIEQHNVLALGEGTHVEHVVEHRVSAMAAVDVQQVV